MSLLFYRDRAQYRLDYAVKALLELNDWDNKYHSLPYRRLLKSDRYVKLCKLRVKRANRNLKLIDNKLSKIPGHAISPSLELIAKLMIIFKPETKEEIEKIITFT